MTRLRRLGSRLRGESGFSLVELVVTMAILGVVLAALTTVFVSGSKAELDMNRRFTAQQNARLAFSSLRTDIHVATCASATNSQLLLYSTTTATQGTCTGSPSTVWCAYRVSSSPIIRDTVYRYSGTACPGTAASAVTAGARPEADYVTTDLLATAVFASVLGGTGQHQSVTVTLPVGTGTNTSTDTYTLSDTIVLRNSPRQP